MKEHKHHLEAGSGHVLLFAIIFVAILGALCFVGFNAWQKQSSDASGANTLGRITTDTKASCSVSGPSSALVTPSRKRYTYTVTVKNTGKVALRDGWLNVGVGSHSGGNPSSQNMYVGRELKLNSGQSKSFKIKIAMPSGFLGDEKVKKYKLEVYGNPMGDNLLNMPVTCGKVVSITDKLGTGSADYGDIRWK